jgi:MSHA biogenesis protein MshM
MNPIYLDYFGLSQAPFGLTPNTGLFQPLQPHQEALQVLKTALEQGEGFLKVTGEVGTGKTLLCRKLLSEMPEQFVFAYLPNPSLDATALAQALAAELGLEPSAQGIHDQINRQLVTLAAENKVVVLVVDEAQALSDASLEALRLLGNLETETRKLLHLVLFGQPELDKRLAEPHLRQLRQRITFSYTLRPLLHQEVLSYLGYRLQHSGYSGGPLFSASAAQTLAKASRGIPRLINVLAHKSLMLCYGKGSSIISNAMVREAIRDTEDAQLGSSARWFKWFLPLSLLSIAGVATWYGGFL